MKAIVLFGALAIAAAPVYAQAVASLSPAPRMQFFDSSGRPLAGGCVQTFAAGSTTPLATYSNAAGTPNTNPVILDASGRADIWLGAGTAYKITVRAKTTGCAGGGGQVLYTTDNIIDQGFSLARSVANGQLAIGLTTSPITGAGGGVGSGNALLSATTGGLYVSVNGAAPVLLNGAGAGGGTPAGPFNSVQYNAGTSLAGSSNFTWNNAGGVLAVCPPPATGCMATSGIQAPAFASTATGTNPAFVAGNGAAQINGNGDATFQDVVVNSTFNSVATGATKVIQQAQGFFSISGAGDAAFQSVAMGEKAAPLTGLGGGVGVGDALLTATPTGLYLSLDGNPPVLISTTGGGGAGTPGSPINSVQFNNAGAFGGSANLLWANSTQTMTITGGATSGFQAPVFSSTNSGTGISFTNSGGTFQVNGNGDGLFGNLIVNGTFNSKATANTPAVAQNTGTFVINGDGNAYFQWVCAKGNPTAETCTYGLSPAGVLTVSSCVGCGGGGAGTAAGPANSIQYNTGTGFGGSASLLWNASANVLTITGGNTSGFQAPAFSSSAAGTDPAFTSAGGTFKITGAGNAGFQTTALGLQSAPVTGLGGGTGVGSAMLSATTGGLWLSVNGGAPALLAAGGAPGGPTNAIQYNTGSGFGGSANLVWDNNAGVLTVGSGANPGILAPVFNSSNTGTNTAMTGGGGTFRILGNGTAAFQSIALTNGITVGSGFYGLTGAGALTVSSCSGCSAGVTSWNTRTGAVTLTKADVTAVDQALGTGDTPTFAGVNASGAFSSAATGNAAAFTQQSGRFEITGNGDTFFQSLCTYNGNPAAGTCNGSTPAAGTILGGGLVAVTQGASIRNTLTNYGIAETDTGGGCNMGTAYAGGVGCSSDERLKKNIRDLRSDALERVLKLRPVTFTWRKNDTPGEGFIAQEVQKVLPGIVRKEDDGFLSMSYQGLIPELVKAVQELTARVAALEARK